MRRKPRKNGANSKLLYSGETKNIKGHNHGRKRVLSKICDRSQKHSKS